MSGRREEAVLGGGCFWCIEAVFKRVPGVLSIEPGYAGGRSEHPTYEAVCTGMTGHAEVVKIAFDPDQISYKAVLDLFFQAHDPTTLNRQGADVGTQYRSIILTQGDDQDKQARQAVEALDRSGTYDQALVTEVVPLTRFYPAEEYHFNYYDRNPRQGYCAAVLRPKLKKLDLPVEPLKTKSG